MKKIKFNGKVYKYTEENLNILDFLIMKEANPNFHCKDGFCGACRCKLNSGSVKERDSLAFKKDNEILICQSTPITDIDISQD